MKKIIKGEGEKKKEGILRVNQIRKDKDGKINKYT